MRIIIEMDGASPRIEIVTKDETTSATTTAAAARAATPAARPETPKRFAVEEPFEETAFDGGAARAFAADDIESPAREYAEALGMEGMGYAANAGAAPDPSEALLDLPSNGDMESDDDMMWQAELESPSALPLEDL